MTIKVMLVDDHEMVRRGLALMLQTFDDLELVGQASDGPEAIEISRAVRPDVILMDLVMPGMNGIQVAEKISEWLPDVKILVLTSFGEQERVREALHAGVIGYLLKDVSVDRLVGAIRQAYAGKPSISADIAGALFSIARQKDPGHDLTPREREVIDLMAEGLSNRLIAVRLGIGTETVKSHVSNLMHKLGAGSRTEVVVLALKGGLAKTKLPPPNGGEIHPRKE